MLHFCLIIASFTVKTLPWAISYNPYGSYLSEPFLQVSSNWRWCWPLCASVCSSVNWDKYSTSSTVLLLELNETVPVKCLQCLACSYHWSISYYCLNIFTACIIFCCMAVPFDVGHLFPVFFYYRQFYNNIPLCYLRDKFVEVELLGQKVHVFYNLEFRPNCSSKRGVPVYPQTSGKWSWVHQLPTPTATLWIMNLFDLVSSYLNPSENVCCLQYLNTIFILFLTAG